jgi:heterodisulfide reductase subunit A-like polyferredoxin
MPQKLVSYIAIELERRTTANCEIEEKDLLIIGGGVAGYVAAIKAGQAGLKVCTTSLRAME